MPMKPSKDVPTLIAEYEATILLRDQVRLRQVAKANKAADKTWRLLRVLAVTAEGRRAVSGLLDSPHAPVRLAAAAGAIPWDAERGLEVLEQLAAEQLFPVSTDARTLLMMYRDGSFRWPEEAGQIMEGPLEATRASAMPTIWDADAPHDYRAAQTLLFETPPDGWRPTSRTAGPEHAHDERIEATVSFHGLVMNGGFLNAFAVMPDKLDLVIAGLDSLRLGKAADLVRTGIGLMASSPTLDDLPDAEAARLEVLGDRYTDLVTDDILFGRIDALETPMSD